MKRYIFFAVIFSRSLALASECSIQSLAEIFAILDQIQEMVDSCSTDTIENEPSWVTIAKKTSKNVAFIQENNTYYCVISDKKFPLEPGDHALWACANGGLYGYARNGRLFYITSSGEKILLTASNCSWLS